PDDVKLLPCPFCNGEATDVHISGSAWFIGANHAPDCHFADFQRSQAEAIAAWNRRTLPSLPSDIDGLVEELERGLEGVTPGPWIRSGVQYRATDLSGKLLAAGPDGGLLFFSPMGGDGDQQAAAIRDLDHIARCHPANIRKLIAALRARQAPEGVVSGDAQPIADRLRKYFDTPGNARRLALDAAMMIEYLNTPRAALSVMPGGEVKVKELSWEQRGKDWYADTPVGHYAVGTYRNHFIAMVRTVDSAHMEDIRLEEQPFDTVDAAKAASQADYETRILSALEGQPS
ncbi:MAG: Lar family restriction alleviation protein, partial [Hyphomicrobiales bacterium]|nr:Lar family restriction alleviation protein [Hyphomicrobiales bacterium]